MCSGTHVDVDQFHCCTKAKHGINWSPPSSHSEKKYDPVPPYGNVRYHTEKYDKDNRKEQNALLWGCPHVRDEQIANFITVLDMYMDAMSDLHTMHMPTK